MAFVGSQVHFPGATSEAVESKRQKGHNLQLGSFAKTPNPEIPTHETLEALNRYLRFLFVTATNVVTRVVIAHAPILEVLSDVACKSCSSYTVLSSFCDPSGRF